MMIRPPGIDNGTFVVTPESVWYTRVLLLFSQAASAQTDTGSKSFDCALMSTLETYDDPELRMVIIDIFSSLSLLHLSLCYSIIAIIVIMEVIPIIQIIDLIAFIQVGWDQLVHGLFTSLTTKIRSVRNTDSE